MSRARIIPDDVLHLQIAGVGSRRLGLGHRECRLRQDPCAGAAGDPAAARWRRSRENPLHHLHQGRSRQHGEPRLRRTAGVDRARRCAARRRDPRDVARCSRTRHCAGARGACSRRRWRRRAGSRCRRFTPSARGCCISSRSRPMSPRALRCWTKRPNRELLSEISLRVMLDAAAVPDGPLGRALATAITFAADQTFKDVVSEAIRKRDLVRKWTEYAAASRPRSPSCATCSASHAHDTREEVESGDHRWPVPAAIRTGPGDAADLRDRLQERPEPGGTRWARRCGASGNDAHRCLSRRVLHRDTVARAIQSSPRGLAKKHPELSPADWTVEQHRLQPLIERRKAVACRDRTSALLTIADAVIARYQAEKDRRGLLDYDDLIDKTLTLLLTDVEAAWVHYKLDRGIDHVLIDEAQDTSPKQWEIVRLLVEEFFAGAGARKRQAHDLRGRRREAVDLFVPGRGAARVRRDAACRSTRMCRAVETEFRTCASAIRSAPARACSAQSTPCSAPADIAASVTTDADGMAPHLALPRRRRGWSSSGSRSSPTPSTRSKPGMRRSTT